MSARPALVRQADLTRCAKGLEAAGVTDWRMVIRPDGAIEITKGKADVARIGPDPDDLLR